MKNFRRNWFKFHGQDFMTDPKMLSLSSAQKVMWITLLCMASSSEERGVVRNLTESSLKILSGILPNSQIDEEWKETEGTLEEFKKLGMITIDGQTITLINFQKRQEVQDSKDPDAVRERVRKHRETKSNEFQSFHVTDCNDREEKSRVEKKREDNINIYTSDFENFWNNYPNKTGKGYASKCWEKINPSEKLQKLIIKKIEEQKKTTKWREGYIPNPSTWLNQSRWEDEIKDNKLPDVIEFD